MLAHRTCVSLSEPLNVDGGMERMWRPSLLDAWISRKWKHVFSCVNPNTEQQKEELIRFVTCREIPFAKLAPFRSFSPRSDSTGCKTMNGRKHTVLRFCSQRLQHLQATSSRDSGFVSGVIVKPGHKFQGAWRHLKTSCVDCITLHRIRVVEKVPVLKDSVYKPAWACRSGRIASPREKPQIKLCEIPPIESRWGVSHRLLKYSFGLRVYTRSQLEFWSFLWLCVRVHIADLDSDLFEFLQKMQDPCK